MNIDKHNVKVYINRFLDGETSNAEEEALYRFFSGNDVPRRLRKYKPMFDWYADGMKEPLPQKHSVRLHPMLAKICAAASIVLAFGVGFGIYQHYQESKLYDCYEGSYIIRDGEKITDIKKILPELRRTTEMAAQQERAVMSEQDKSTEDYLKEIKAGQNAASPSKENLPVI